MFVIDKARRSLLPKAPLNEDAKQEMQTHIEDLRKQISLFKEQRTRAGVRASLKTISDMLKHIHDEHVDERFSRWKIKPVPHEDAALSENIPWATVFAVIVDSGVDGVLIGLALAAKEAAGISMAIATCIEMGKTVAPVTLPFPAPPPQYNTRSQVAPLDPPCTLPFHYHSPTCQVCSTPLSLCTILCITLPFHRLPGPELQCNHPKFNPVCVEAHRHSDGATSSYPRCWGRWP